VRRNGRKLSLLAAGCANFTGNGSMAPVSEGMRCEIGKDVTKHASPECPRRARDRVQAMLAGALAKDAALIAMMEAHLCLLHRTSSVIFSASDKGVVIGMADGLTRRLQVMGPVHLSRLRPDARHAR
jgi:hypothetical protein